MNQKFTITGMNCSACAAHVENAVKNTAGVTDASVNLLTNTLYATFDEAAVTADDIIAAVTKSGYGAELLVAPTTQMPPPRRTNDTSATPPREGNSRHQSRLPLSASASRLIVSLVFMVVLMYVAMGHMLSLPLPAFLHQPVGLAFAQFLLCVPIIYANRAYFANGFRRLFTFAPNMDTLIAVGSAASLLYGIVLIFLMTTNPSAASQYAHSLYFESAGMILALVTLGKFLEDGSKNRTMSALEQLKNLAPNTALLKTPTGEITVDVAMLNIGDIVIVKSGATLPTDGVVTAGQCYIDNSMLTGESVPVTATAGTVVTGGTVNTGGYIEVKVTALGSESVLSKIITLVEDANATKPPIAKLADKIAGIFVPIVLGIAAVTLAVWWIVTGDFATAFNFAISVLVVSCPCAMGLATPLAVMVGTGKGAENGILIKSGDAVERLSRVTNVVLDKTGTLTYGQPTVTDVVCEEAILQLAASLEVQSEHPTAAAVVAYAEKNGIALLPAADFVSHFGRGVTGTVSGHSVAVGNARHMEELHISVDNAEHIDYSQQGKTPLLVAVDGAVQGVIAVADAVKPDSAAAVAALKAMGLSVAMLTGDNRLTAAKIAKDVAIDTVYSEVLPDGKADIVAAVKAAQGATAMVGDGVNDAPSLAVADVGISMSSGSDIAVGSADVVLLKNSVAAVATAVKLCRKTLANIKQNLFWAFFYNAALIPLAAGVLFPALGVALNPMIAAAAMSVSSLFVVGTALRLKLFKASK
jgi:Cu+-exporting ATPase